jgi:hypothetical protein
MVEDRDIRRSRMDELWKVRRTKVLTSSRDMLTPMTHNDLTPLAKQLRFEGITAEHIQIGQQHQNGLSVLNSDGTEDFFSLAELNDPANADLLESRDFAGIKARRPPGTQI